MKFRHCCLATATLLSILYVPVQAGARQSWQSPAAAEALLQHLETTNTDAIAVRDPERPERFIAALRLPGQLLVVSATHPTVDLLQARLDRGEHRNLYMDLQGTPSQDTKFFVHDLDADGLNLEGRGQASDMIYDGGSMLTCDGRWKEAKLDKDEYHARIAAADERYARLLTLLTTAAAPATAARR